MTNLQILSHNISYAYLGVDQNNIPVIQTSTLDIGKSLHHFERFLTEFYIRRTGHNTTAKIHELLTALAAEYQTITSVLRHLAYSNQEFFPQLYAEEIYRPHNWAGMSYHRLVALTHWGVCNQSNIESAVRAVAAQEAADVHTSITVAANHTTDLVLIDAAAYHALAGGEETI